MSRTILIMAGGTGGHIFPGLAVAGVLEKQGWRIVWMGNPEGMESRLVPAHGYEMSPVRFGALRGKGLMRKLLLPWALLSGFRQAWREIRRVRPDVVLGMGGYISFPGGLMASLMGCPLVIHEQNAIAGLANRVLAWVADRVVCGFPDALRKGEWVGNPVRDQIARIEAPDSRLGARNESEPLHLLVLGGSLGADAINRVVPEGIALIEKGNRPQILHQAGEKHLAQLEESYRAARVDARCVAFIEDMASAYAWADLVLCRAGALTVAELAAAGVASILVPFPSAVDDHQTFNAKFLTSTGGAILLPQEKMTPESISLIRNYTRGQMLQMAEKARARARPDAAAGVARICEAVCRRTNDRNSAA